MGFFMGVAHCVMTRIWRGLRTPARIDAKQFSWLN